MHMLAAPLCFNSDTVNNEPWQVELKRSCNNVAVLYEAGMNTSFSNKGGGGGGEVGRGRGGSCPRLNFFSNTVLEFAELFLVAILGCLRERILSCCLWFRLWYENKD